MLRLRRPERSPRLDLTKGPLRGEISRSIEEYLSSKCLPHSRALRLEQALTRAVLEVSWEDSGNHFGDLVVFGPSTPDP